MRRMKASKDSALALPIERPRKPVPKGKNTRRNGPGGKRQRLTEEADDQSSQAQAQDETDRTRSECRKRQTTKDSLENETDKDEKCSRNGRVEKNWAKWSKENGKSHDQKGKYRA